MRLLLKTGGLDPRLSAALRSQAFNLADRNALEGSYDVVAISNKGQTKRPETEASYVALLPTADSPSLGSMGFTAANDVIKRCLRVVAIPHNEDLPGFEHTKFVDFMNIERDEIVKLDLRVDDPEKFGRIIAQYLFVGNVNG